MKVLHVIPALAPRYGGPSQAVLDMGRALLGHGVGLLIATTDADGPGRLPVERGRARCHAGVPTIFFARQWSEAFKYSRPLAAWLEAHVAEFDVVHIHAVFSHASLAAGRSSARRGVPYLVRPLGTLDPWSLRQKPLRKRLVWHLGARRLLAGAAAIHYTTRAEQRLAEAPLGLTRGVVVPLGVDPRLFAAPQPGDGGRPYLLALSRLHPKKGLGLLVDTFLEVTSRRDLAHWRLVLAGEGEASYVDGLRRLVRERGGDQRIRFAGWLEGAEKAAALRGAALFALPSHQENFGISAAESMACGVPVLVSAHVNLAPEIQAAGAGWVVPLEPAAMARSLAEAMSDAAGRQRRGAAARELARSRFAWPPIAARLAQLYGSIAARGGEPPCSDPARPAPAQISTHS